MRDGACRNYSRQRAHPFENLLIGSLGLLPPGLLIVELRSKDGQFHRQHIFRIEARIHAQQLPKAAHHQTRSGQQHQR